MNGSRFVRSESGQSVVELALVLPILCVLVMGIVGFGIFFSKYQTLTAATSAAARFEATCRTQLPGRDASTVGETAAASLSNATFKFTYVSNGTPAPYGSLCNIPSGTKIKVVGQADPYLVNLGFYSYSFPLSSTVTIAVA